MTQATDRADMRGTWLVLTMTCICMTIIAYNTTAVITALPAMIAAFDLSPTAQQWVMTIYMVIGAALVTVMGRLGDSLGKMRMFLVGMAIFSLGSLAVAVSFDDSILFLGRGVQGIGAATLMGNSLSVLSAATPEPSRAFVMAVWGAMVALGMSLGPIIGGFFAEFVSWRGIFVSDLVFYAVAFAIAMRVIRAGYVGETKGKSVRIDYFGAILLILLLGPLAYALGTGEDNGWTSAPTLIALLVAALAAIAFYLVEKRSREPLLHLQYFRHPRFVMATAGMFVTAFVLLGFFFYFSTFVQSPDAMAMSAIVAGAAVLPTTMIMFIFSVSAARFLAPYSFRWPLIIGMTALIVAFLLLYDIGNTTTYEQMWWKLAILGLGLGLTFPLLPRVGLRLLPEAHAGQGSGVVNTCLFFGATLGIVVCGIAQSLMIRANIASVVDALPAALPDRDTVVQTLTRGSPDAVSQTLARLDPPTTQALAEVLRDVQDDAFGAAMLVCAAVSAIGLALAVGLMRGPVPAPHSAAEPAPADAKGV